MDRLSKKRIKIFFCYQWEIRAEKEPKDEVKNQVSNLAMKKLQEMLKNSLKENFLKVDFRRLRATAGNFVFDSIYSKIKEADFLIFDISHSNNNVMLELGMALSIQREINPQLKIYIIQENNDKALKLPSDIQGYFASSYRHVKNKSSEQMTFKDGSSLIGSMRNSVLSLINDYFVKDTPIQLNELND
jgi:hypothetical protein